MKKFFAILVLSLSCLTTTSAYNYTSTCGKTVQTVGPEYFNGDYRAWFEWLIELDEMLCMDTNPVSPPDVGPEK